jgi:tRNA wybutosine-synthesizing protein 2
MTRPTPREIAARFLELPEELEKLLPSKWEMLGSAVILKLRKELENYKTEIGKAYARALGARSLYAVTGQISGPYRKPSLELIYGEEGPTVHSENGVRYVLDVSKVMFSSANHDERMRMANLDCRNETVVDMFAGIGHLSMPIAVHSSPSRIIAAEADADTFEFLLKTIEANNVGEIFQAWNTDNSRLEVTGADRIIMGYLENTTEWLPKALSMCRTGAVIHLHQAVRRGRVNEWRNGIDRRWGAAGDGSIAVENVRRVKSYSALLDHMVADLRVIDSNRL